MKCYITSRKGFELAKEMLRLQGRKFLANNYSRTITVLR